jgi:NAD(P)-dependent dehydrogenase (short-subunit alcohol dehydrogenase family)
MAGRVAGKVAFITGAARGQGRSHALRLAQEGADIIAVDLCQQVASVPYAMSTPEDLAETVKEIEALDRRIVAAQADVRDCGAVSAALDDGVAQLVELAPDMIRVNSVHPTAVDTDMIQNSATYELFAADLPEAERTRDVVGARFAELNALPIPWVEAVDISNVVLWLASDESRYVTGVTLPIDAGSLVK